MKTQIRLFAIAISTAISAFYAQASILVQDSFDAAGYIVGTNLKNLKPGESTGFGAGTTWGTSSSTGVFFVNDGLTLPADFIASSKGQAIGVGKFSGDTKGSREISRQITSGIINNAGTYYIRFACAITASAESYLGFKGFELLGLLPEQHANSSAISYPASNGLQFGFYKMGLEVGTTALVALKEGGANANVTALKLVDPIVPGKTYIVVAKIVLDGEGGAEVYAMAGAADDAAFRSAKLPSEPLAVTVSPTAALQHLVCSGTFMTGYGSGTLQDRWASFDEFAIGESLEDVFGFNDLTVPVLGDGSSTDIGASGFTANGELTQLGESNPEVFFDISDDDGSIFTSSFVGVYSATGAVVTNVVGLSAGSTYAWRFRAIGTGGTAVMPWQSVTLAGAPVLGEPAAVVEGDSATLSVSLVTPGLSGTTDTTVELWFAEDGQPLSPYTTFDPTDTPDDFQETVENLSLGGLYRYAFRATVPYSNKVLETWTATNDVAISGDIAWTGANGTDWNTAGNWEPQIAPNERLGTRFGNVGGNVVSIADGTASSIFVNTTGDGTSFNFGGNALTAESLTVGNEVSRSRAAIGNGIYSFGSIVVAGQNNRAFSRLDIGSGADLTAGSIDIGYDADPASASNSVVFATGSKTSVSGTLLLRSSRGTSATVEQGASLSVGGLNLSAVGASLVVDGGAFTNNGQTLVFKENRRGTARDDARLVLKNGADCRFAQVNIGAGINYSSQPVHGEVQVLDGAVLDATGYGIFIDQGEKDYGPYADSGQGAILVVSNATVLANTLSVNNEDRHHDDVLLVHEDAGRTARVALTSNLRIACATQTRSGHYNYDNRMRVESGEVSIGGTLFVGDGGQHYANHASNRVEIAGANPRISANAMNVYGMSFIDFEIPKDGYAGIPLSITGTAKFDDVPTGQDSASWTPVNGIRVDVSKFIGRQTLVHAGTIAGLTADRVFVTGRDSEDVSVTVTDTDVIVDVKKPGFVIIIR